MKSGIRGKSEGTLHEIKGESYEMTGKITDQELEANGKPEIQACRWCAPPEKKMIGMRHSEEGKIGWVLLWALGIPIPILVALYLLRGCT
jgi:hypothetical protein